MYVTILTTSKNLVFSSKIHKTFIEVLKYVVYYYITTDDQQNKVDYKLFIKSNISLLRNVIRQESDGTVFKAFIFKTNNEFEILKQIESYFNEKFTLDKQSVGVDVKALTKCQ